MRLVVVSLVSLALSACCLPSSSQDRLTELAAENALEAAAGVEIDQSGGKLAITAEDGTKISVDGAGNTMTIAGAEGTATFTGDGGTYPEGMPVGAYPGAKIVAVMDMAGSKQVVLESTDAPDAVARWYLEAVGEAPLMDTSASDGASAGRSMIWDNGATNFAVNLGGEPGKTTIALTSGPKR